MQAVAEYRDIKHTPEDFTHYRTEGLVAAKQALGILQE